MSIDNKSFWRKDITGLRALAVIPVLIYHAFPDLLPGGFYGVDIFFVISGYLISGIIFRGLISDAFSFKDFYFKRVKRILPNLIAVLIFVMAVGWFVLNSDEYRRLGVDVYRSAFFYQNFNLMSGPGYFDGTEQNNPLLHIWSLAIEEQFYLCFPLFAFLIWKIGQKSIRCLGLFVAFITVASFLCCLFIDDQSVRFYLPVSRFWELGVGICLAYAETFIEFDLKNHSQESADTLSVLGVLMVLISLLTPTSWYAAPPGCFSLMPVLGSSLLILANTHGVVNRTILSWSGMVFVGLISYSLYLWHWPLLAYLRVCFYQPKTWMIFLTLFFSLTISIVVYRWVENPIRRLPRKHDVWCVSLLLILLVGVFYSGKLLRHEYGFPNREIAKTLSWLTDWTYPEGLQKHDGKKHFLAVDPDNIPEIIFVGDSHMEQYHSRIVKLAEVTKKNIGFITDSGCMASVGIDSNGKNCENATKELDDIIDSPRLRTLVIGQKWGSYESMPINVLIDGWNAYINLINEFIRKDPKRRVFVLLDNPWDESGNQEFNHFRYLSNRFLLEGKVPNEILIPLPESEVWKYGNEYIEANAISAISFINTAEQLCPRGICNLRGYKDDDHLNSSYVRENATWIDQVFK